MMAEALPPMQQSVDQAVAAQPDSDQEMGVLAKFQLIVRYSLDLVGDMVSAVWDGIKGLLGMQR